MRRFLKNKIFSNAIIFTLSTLINKGMNFLILPVLTYYLTKEDYGMIGLIGSIVTISMIYVGFFPSTFIMVKFDKFGKEKMARYLSNILILMVGTFLVVLALLYLFKGYYLVDLHEDNFLVFSIGLLCFFQVFWFILGSIVQLEKNAIKYGLLQLVQTALTLGLTLLLVIEFSWGWRGKFYAELSTYGLFALYTLYYLYKAGYLRFDLDIQKLKEIVGYLFPLTFFVLGLFVMGTIDKVFIANLVSVEAAGLYAVAITMTIIINMVFDSALKAWEPHAYELLNEESSEAKRKVVKVTYLFSLFVVVSVGLYILIVPYFFHLMIDAKFDGALIFLPVLIVGYGFEGLRKPISIYLNYYDYVKLTGGITLLAALLNVGLNLWLIPLYGAMGAAYATLLSFLVLYLLTLFFVYKYTGLPWFLR